MASNAKNLAELLNNETTIAVADVADGSITTAKLADDAVTSAKLGASAVDATALASNAVTTAKVADGAVTSVKTTNVSGRRNIAYNGAMQIAQRGTSQADISSGGYYTVDRFKVSTNSAGRATMTQESITDLPGFANAIKLDCTTADTSLGSGEYLQLSQYFEGQDLQSFKKGTSSAEKVTVSFYVKGNGNATYVCELFDGDNTRRTGIQFSVTSSWNRVSLTFDGDTTGAFDDDNDLSLYLNLWLAAGSGYSGGTYTANSWQSNFNANRAVGGSNFYSSTDNTFFITGFQVEVGDSASDFEHRSFGEELRLCQRYYQRYITDATFDYGAIATAIGSTARWYIPFPLDGPMRTDVTLTYSDVSHFRLTLQHSDNNTATAFVISYNHHERPMLGATAGSNSAGSLRMFGFNGNASAYFALDAEL